MEPLSFTYYESIDKQESSNCFSLLYKRAQMSIQEYNDMIIILHAIKLLKH